MSVPAVDSSASTVSAIAAAAQSSSKSASSQISMSDFMKILAAELQYQDPMSDSSSGGGSSSSSYITQMVEYNLLAQVESMTSQMKYASAPGMVGQTVLYAGTDKDGNLTYTTGIVSAVELSGDSPAYLINGVWVDQSNIAGVYQKGSSGSTTPSA